MAATTPVSYTHLDVYKRQASTSFVESTLAQKYRVPDPLYGGWRGGPAYYLHVLARCV